MMIGLRKVRKPGGRGMNLWENTVLTDQGKALQAKLLKGQTLKIRRVTTGAKKVPVVDLRQQTSVTEGGFDITLQPARTEGDSTILSVLLENRGLKESYELWQVGFYAEDPDEGEILFCLAQASQVKNIPSEAESPGFSITWDFYFNTSNTVPFEVVLNSAGLVNIEAYQVHTKAINEIKDRVGSMNLALNKKANQTDLQITNSNVSNIINSSKSITTTRIAKNSSAVTIAPNTYAFINAPAPSVTGYIPIAVRRLYPGSDKVALIQLSMDGYRVGNYTSSPVTVNSNSSEVEYLYIRTSL